MLTSADRIPSYPWEKHNSMVKNDGRPYFRSYTPNFVSTNQQPIKFFFEKKEEVVEYLNDKHKNNNVGNHTPYKAKILNEEYADGIKLVVMENDMDVFVAGYIYNLN